MEKRMKEVSWIRDEEAWWTESEKRRRHRGW